ncbi:MAG: methyltransferase domain-containing protein [Hyphomicrobium sp.]
MTSATVQKATGLEAVYAAKPASYFANARIDFVARLPADPTATILEIGCGNGATGALALSAGRCERYVGVELVESVAAEAQGVLSEVLVGNVEVLDFYWPPASFDAILMSEVLEHLVEPEQVVRRLARFVRPGGLLLASSPNISHWRVIRELICGRFHQADQGVFDRTHLRWFTPETFAAMFETAGFRILEIGPVTPFSSRTEIISKLMGGRFDHLFMAQIAVVAVKR